MSSPPTARTLFRVTAGLGGEGPNGNITPQRLLEWLQDAAAAASARGGFPADRYRSMNAGWFVKEILLAVDHPIHYGDELVIETWVSDLRRFRSHREYRVRCGEKLVARARTDWLFLERNIVTGKVRPLRPDEEMLTAFPIDPEIALHEEEVPSWTAPSEPSLIDKRIVRASELDRHQHVNHVVYLGWAEDHARLVYGTTSELFRARIEYMADAKLSDEISVASHGIDGQVLTQMTRGDQPLVHVSSLRTPG